jgi:hypothetical protein
MLLPLRRGDLHHLSNTLPADHQLAKPPEELILRSVAQAAKLLFGCRSRRQALRAALMGT